MSQMGGLEFSDLLFDSEPILGWRVWRTEVKRKRSWHEPHLFSVTYHVRWPVRQPMRAHCVTSFRSVTKTDGWHYAPEVQHNCGIYATKEFSGVIPWMPNGQSLMSYNLKSPYVVGAIALWGRVIRHENGYRGEYAYPVWFSERLSTHDDIQYLAERYGVQVKE